MFAPGAYFLEITITCSSNLFFSKGPVSAHWDKSTCRRLLFMRQKLVLAKSGVLKECDPKQNIAVYIGHSTLKFE